MDNTPNIQLQDLDFQPLSWAKARLSAIVKALKTKKIVLTTNGRPTAVLLSYNDFLNLTSPGKSSLPDETTIRFEDWKKGKQNREKVRDSITSLFDVSMLTRKGQKKYKEETVRELDRKLEKRTR